MKTFIPVLFLAAALSAACTPQRISDLEPSPVKIDSLFLHIEAHNAGGAAVSHADFFIFSDSGVRPLEKHIRTEGGSVLDTAFAGSLTDKIAVCIANCPYKFKDEAITRYESAEELVLGLKEDNPDMPVMSGIVQFCPDGYGFADEEITLTPLLCRVRIRKIINFIGGYTRFEDPVIYLQNINNSAQLMRQNGFRLTETGICSDTLVLKSDIGANPAEPDAVFYVYPNDSRENGAGTPATEIVLEGKVKGVRRTERIALPAFGRNSSISVEITLEAETAEAEFSTGRFDGQAAPSKTS